MYILILTLIKTEEKTMEKIDTKEFKNIKNEMNFLCKPVIKGSSNIPKIYDNHVLNDGKYWYATDGSRLHKIESGPDHFGIWKVIKNTKIRTILEKTDKQVNEFPDMKSIFPNTSDAKRVACEYAYPEITYAKIIRTMDNNTLNFHFLEDVLCDTFTAFIVSDTDPIVFENGTKTALIMPMRI